MPALLLQILTGRERRRRLAAYEKSPEELRSPGDCSIEKNLLLCWRTNVSLPHDQHASFCWK
jgi:hypothetical protein